MNYLAHFILSNNKENLIIGNYIADDIRGDDYLDYPKEIQKGILLHRKIDDFTDHHKVVSHSKSLIHNDQNKFSPVVMDVFYDYFLIKNWALYSDVELLGFTKDIYKVLFKNISGMPLKSSTRLPFMAKSNWLYNYGKVEGIKKTLTGLSKRTSYANNMANAYKIMIELEEEINTDFKLFFPDLIQCVNDEIKRLNG